MFRAISYEAEAESEEEVDEEDQEESDGDIIVLLLMLSKLNLKCIVLSNCLHATTYLIVYFMS